MSKNKYILLIGFKLVLLFGSAQLVLIEVSLEALML